MNKLISGLLIILFPLIILAGNFEPQSKLIKVKPVWNPPTCFEDPDFCILSFQGSGGDDQFGDLPVFVKTIRPGHVPSNISLSLDSTKWELLDINTELISDIDKVPSEPLLQSVLSFDAGQPIIILKLLPFVKSNQPGVYKKLSSATINISWDEKSDSHQKSYSGLNFKENSVLSSGTWYRLKIKNTGIHKISYALLQDMGLDVSELDPKKIRIYGNGGGMLSEINTDFRYDDLAENAIFVNGESDGSFDQNDFILFFAGGPHEWKYNELKNKFEYHHHLYSDHYNYFFTIGSEDGKRIQVQSNSTEPANNTVTSFNDFAAHEIDERNLLKSGRIWYGETYDYTTTYDFDFSFPNIVNGSEVILDVSGAAASDISSTFRFYLNNEQLISTSVPAINPEASFSAIAKSFTEEALAQASSSTIEIKTQYIKSTSSSVGYLDYIQLNTKRQLTLSGDQMDFRSVASVGDGVVSEFRLDNSSGNVTIWNVTDKVNPRKIDASLQGDMHAFTLPTDSLLEFIAFNGASYYTPEYVGKVNNQNLHGMDVPDMVIVTHPGFTSEAERLADFHELNDGMNVFVVEPQLIYNEFSSGIQDISAIRDFMKMLYEKGQKTTLKYLLLFGDGSYDYKNRASINHNFVPAWQSSESLHPVNSYTTDDFYGILDHSSQDVTLDIGIGRLVVTTADQAAQMVDKIIHYATSPVTLSDWRNYVCLVADDEDGNLHMGQADDLATQIMGYNKDFNIDKIFLDAYQQQSTPGGARYPDVNSDINRRMDKGCLILNYTGHGGEVGWAEERVLENADINSWTNFDNMPVFLTATCEFSRFDDPDRTSSGEYVLLNPNGGAIALFTTTRATYSGANMSINTSFYKYTLQKFDGEYLRMGDIIRRTKNDDNNTSSNGRKFVLLGDPALKLPIPRHKVMTTAINNHDLPGEADTIRALSQVTIEGIVTDVDGNLLENFSGLVYPTVYDKESIITTLANDGGSPMNFELRKNRLYKGKAEVQNGIFSFEFLVPKDIAYNYGPGRISYYAENGSVDATGHFEEFFVGGFDESAGIDNNGPQVRLYMDDESFVNGETTGKNSVLIAHIEDESGINTVGNGIGHDLTAILDDRDDEPIILNDYYESELGDFTKGTITFPISGLSNGNHSISVNVWDVYNNSTEACIEFVVEESSLEPLTNVMNFPNPVTSTTTFAFDYNLPGDNLEVEVLIFNSVGKLVKNIETTIYSCCGNSETITPSWDGSDNFGNRLENGMFIYKIRVKGNRNGFAEKSGKMILAR